MQKNLMTVEGERKLRERLRHLKHIERPAIVIAIEEARAHGDLSENAEYHSAKDKQGLNEAHIRDIEAKLSLAQVIDPSTLSGDRVIFGATVLMSDLDTDEEVRYRIVGVDEANPQEGMISYTSPVAKALLGKLVDDLVEVQTPGGTRDLEILEITFE